MKRVIEHIESQYYTDNTEIAIYGKCGVSIILFSQSKNDILESEHSGLIELLLPLLRKGKFKIFSVANPCSNIWESDKSPEEKSELLHNFNMFITSELLPFIFNSCGTPVPIITAGSGKGAFHAANTFFRRPDIFIGTIVVNGTYDLSDITGNYFDDNCYFNSPMHFLPNLTDPYWMTFLKNRRHIYLSAGQSDLSADSTVALSNILAEKNIVHDCNITKSAIDGSQKDTNDLMLASVKRILTKAL